MSSRRAPGVVFAKRQGCNGSTCTLPSSSVSSTPSLTDSTTSNGSSSSVAQTSATTSTQSPSPTELQAATSSSTSNAGTIAGSVIGGVVFLVLVLLAMLLYLRARKRKRTPPSSEFINSLKAGATPVLRLDSGAEYTPTLTEVYTHYSPAVPLPSMQNSYYSTSPVQNMKFPDEMMAMTDISSRRPSVERPLHPQRFSSQQHANDSFVAQHHTSTSVGSRRELWGSETEIVSGDLSPVHQSSFRADPVLHFAPRISLDEPSTQPLCRPHSPTSLQPLRRQPDLDSAGHV